MPAEKDHPVFRAPSDENIKIWRYMDFTKFVSLLETKALFFSRIDLLGDPYEGAISHFNITARPQVYKDAKTVQDLGALASHHQWERQWTFANCWHMNEVESAAMWSLYARSNEAVAIQSTYARLHAAFPSKEHPFEKVYLGEVDYIDYDNDWLPEGNAFSRFMHKRKSYAHERELRALMHDLPTKFVDMGELGRRRVPDYHPNPKAGRSVPIALDEAIENVFVAPLAPQWFRHLVEMLLSRYSVNIRIAPSNLDKPPVF